MRFFGMIVVLLGWTVAASPSELSDAMDKVTNSVIKISQKIGHVRNEIEEVKGGDKVITDIYDKTNKKGSLYDLVESVKAFKNSVVAFKDQVSDKSLKDITKELDFLKLKKDYENIFSN